MLGYSIAEKLTAESSSVYLCCLKNRGNLYDTVGNAGSVWGIKKRVWYSRQASPTFSGVEVAGWVLLGCLGEVLKLMELTEGFLVHYGFPTSLMNQPCE